MSDRPRVQAWAPTVAPGLVPGGMLVRWVSLRTDRLLDSRALTSTGEAEAAGGPDLRSAEDWLLAHPQDTVFGFLYDGDTGDCTHTIVMMGPDADEEEVRRVTGAG